MVEPEELVAALVTLLSGGPLRGTTVLINAGPTREPLDPVRFLSNRSSGRMGFALAEEAARRGARVLLVAGPVDLPTPPAVAERRDVETAEQMRDQVYRLAPEADLVILTAAVADFRPAQRQAQKIKKDDDPQSGLELRLERTPDVLAGLSEVAPQALRVGFAAETERLEQHAREKLARKRVHYLVANDVSRADIGFGSESNEVTVYGADGSARHLERRPNREIAGLLLDLFSEALAARPAGATRGDAGRGGTPAAGAP
jgi:phosphopantothenoylcysteine decarboxylase/phosphopantothenate--cysteine ligase